MGATTIRFQTWVLQVKDQFSFVLPGSRSLIGRVKFDLAPRKAPAPSLLQRAAVGPCCRLTVLSLQAAWCGTCASSV